MEANPAHEQNENDAWKYAPYGRIEINMSVDHGINWPLSDALWEKRLNWDELITRELKQRLHEWRAFFSAHASIEECAFGSEQNRRWFDLEAVALLNELDRQIDGRFKVILDLWY